MNGDDSSRSRSRCGTRRDAARYGAFARARAAAVVAVHREPRLRHALLDGARLWRDGAVHLSSAASTRPAKSSATSSSSGFARRCSRRRLTGALRAGHGIGDVASAQTARHHAMGDARFLEYVAARREAVPRVERHRRHLCVDDHRASPRDGAPVDRAQHQRRADAAPAPVASDGDAADVSVGEAAGRSRSARLPRPSRARASMRRRPRPIRALPARAARRRTRRRESGAQPRRHPPSAGPDGEAASTSHCA